MRVWLWTIAVGHGKRRERLVAVRLTCSTGHKVEVHSSIVVEGLVLIRLRGALVVEDAMPTTVARRQRRHRGDAQDLRRRLLHRRRPEASRGASESGGARIHQLQRRRRRRRGQRRLAPGRRVLVRLGRRLVPADILKADLLRLLCGRSGHRRPRRQHRDKASQRLLAKVRHLREHRVCHDALSASHGVLGVVGQVAVTHRIQRQARTPHVGRFVALLAPQTLGSHKLDGVLAMDVAALTALAQDLARSQVRQQRPRCRCLPTIPRGFLASNLVDVQQDIRGLEVSVQDAAAVQMPQAAADVQEQCPNQLFGHHRRFGGVVAGSPLEAGGPN
mmetsp:Transcript_85852/g.246383  ORF Transcript_85852/g.246383 Transcript_85852/m.246383 type:complete len:332 (-) Transcript_85852:1514-2509(-)